MYGPEVSLAGERWTTAKLSPGLPEMRPAAIWHEGTQLILLTFLLVNKCLKITWSKTWTRGKPIQRKSPPTPPARSRAGEPWQ